MEHRSNDKLAMEDIKRVDANAFGNDEYSEISTLPTTKRLFIYATCMQLNIPEKNCTKRKYPRAFEAETFGIKLGVSKFRSLENTEC